MRVLIAGGVFRLSLSERQSRQPAPEILLADGLKNQGISVTTSPLEDLTQVILRKQYDIAHVHHFSKAALAAALSLSATPFIFTEHGMPPRGKSSHEFARRVILRRASAVVCLSDQESFNLQSRNHLDSTKIHVLPNPVSMNNVHPNLRILGNSRFQILFVGQLIALKQVDRIIRLLPKVDSNVYLRVVTHNPELRGALQYLAEELGVADRVQFDGPLAGPSLIQAYAQANVLILPSAHEALPSVISEALITGLPVIASDVGGIAGQLSGSGILIDPKSDDSLTSAFHELSKNYEDYAKGAVDRGNSIMNELNAEIWVRKHIQIYETALNSMR